MSTSANEGVAAPQSSIKSDQLVGSVISLITNAQVRYEGTLIDLDKVQRSMHLQNVKSFGSEGRRNGVGEIPAHENEIGSVIFKVDHIKDFQIIKRPDVKVEKQDENVAE